MDKIRLKKFITHRNKTLMVVLLGGVFTAFYSLCGAITAQYANQIPLLKWEENLPLVPSTIIIYIVFYPLYLVWSVYALKSEESLNKLLYGFSIMSILTFAIFLIFPITYPRDYYPLSLSNDPITLIFRAVRAVDKPSNCLPSLHVALCFLFGFHFLHENKKKFWFAMGMSSLVALSTLTTKQHYFYDIVTGFLIAFFWLALDRFSEVSPT